MPKPFGMLKAGENGNRTVFLKESFVYVCMLKMQVGLSQDHKRTMLYKIIRKWDAHNIQLTF